MPIVRRLIDQLISDCSFAAPLCCAAVLRTYAVMSDVRNKDSKPRRRFAALSTMCKTIEFPETRIAVSTYAVAKFTENGMSNTITDTKQSHRHHSLYETTLERMAEEITRKAPDILMQNLREISANSIGKHHLLYMHSSDQTVGSNNCMMSEKENSILPKPVLTCPWS